jgi:hypothetical protein
VVYWTKLPAAISSDISFVAAGKNVFFAGWTSTWAFGPRAGALPALPGL